MHVEGSEASSVPNSLVLMQGEKKRIYSDIYLGSCYFAASAKTNGGPKQNRSEEKEESINRP